MHARCCTGSWPKCVCLADWGIRWLLGACAQPKGQVIRELVTLSCYQHCALVHQAGMPIAYCCVDQCRALRPLLGRSRGLLLGHASFSVCCKGCWLPCSTGASVSCCVCLFMCMYQTTLGLLMSRMPCRAQRVKTFAGTYGVVAPL